MALAQNITFLANGYSLADALTSISPMAEVNEVDATVLANNYRTYALGFKSGSIAVTGIFDSDGTNLDEIHDVFSSVYTSGADVIITSSLGTVAAGADAIMMVGCNMKYDLPIDTGELIFSNAEFKSKTSVDFGKWLMNVLVTAGTTNGTSVDGTAATTNGGLFIVHLHNDDATDVDVKLQDSANNTDWVDVASAVVNNLSATHTAGYIAITGTVRRYIRAVATVTGGDTFLVSAAFARR
jgi:hypothetical protein